MNCNESKYLSISHLAKKYDLHPDTIRRKDLIEGIHYIRIGRTIRYDTATMHSYLCTTSTDDIDSILDKFFID